MKKRTSYVCERKEKDEKSRREEEEGDF